MDDMLPDDSASLMTPLDKRGRLKRLNRLLEEVLPANAFQRKRLGEKRVVNNRADFLNLPLLSKKQLVEDCSNKPPFGTNLTYSPDQYTRFHQTSGTTGIPLGILDTDESWDWWGRCWLEVFRAASVTASDRLFFAFSFAPSIGFWSSYKAGEILGALLIPSGGANTDQRLRMIMDLEPTVLLCTPSYALRLAEVAKQRGASLTDSSIHTLIHAGEPGASIPQTRRRLEQAWGATVIDHAGATEIGAWGIGIPSGPGLYVNEDEFIAEIIDRDTQLSVAAGETGELVITALGREAWPVIRYRTGDVVRAERKKMDDGSTRLWLDGGVLGRADDMVTIRGVNVYPSAIENAIREVAGLCEFRAVVSRRHEMDELSLELECDSDMCDSVARLIRERIGVRVIVNSADANSLPRWEAKSRRFVDERCSS